MSKKELERHRILNLVLERTISQVKAASILKISDRQVRNLLKQFKTKGPEGLISKKRGYRSNRALLEKRKQVLQIIQKKYPDFAPTLICEKLEESHGIILSHETIRKWMIAVHLWNPKQKKKKTHPPRMRRYHFGEMIQADGSHDAWFEDRRAKCVLLVFVDDATSKITAMRFCERESLQGYFETLKMHLIKYGKPLTMYTDRFSVFESILKENLTQFKRALKTLDIDWIGANSPQAKGRVERCNRTLQDRLIKEMRLRKINTIEEGNIFLEEYIETYNNKFSKEPMKPSDLHRPLEREIDLSRALSKYEERTLTKDLVFQYENKHFRITDSTKKCFKGQKIEIRKTNENMRVYIQDTEVEYMPLNSIVEERTNQETSIKLHWQAREDWHQCENHPWKKHSMFLKKREEEIKKYKNGIMKESGNF